MNASRGIIGWLIVLLLISIVSLNNIYMLAPIFQALYAIIFKERIERLKQEAR
jgi:hypothetical protein